MADIKFQKNKNWDKVFNSANGMVGRQIKKDAREVEQIAKATVDRKTGNLARNTQADKVPTPTPIGPQIDVTANTDYAVYHHEGTRPGPRRASDGSTYMHPGTEGEPFLSDALVAVTNKYL